MPTRPASDASSDDDASDDVTSDPALADSPGHEWESEGGATPEGPATDTDGDA